LNENCNYLLLFHHLQTSLTRSSHLLQSLAQLASLVSFLHVPWLMSALYSLFSSFTNARTRSKFTMVSSGDVEAELDGLIGRENLPTKYAENH